MAATLLRTPTVFGILLALAAFAPAQGPFDKQVPQAKAAPEIDGVINPEEWAGAVTFENFTQVEPSEGAPPSERTVVYLLCDATHLYLGFRCYDSKPDEIRAALMTRDARLDPDDRIELVLDTFHDKRNAYFFQIGAGGSQGDGLLGPNFFTKDWDGIWHGRSSVDDEGWSAELAIPATTISMGTEHDTFGRNIRRDIKRTNERIQWSSPRRNTSIFTVAGAGVIRGVGGLDQGVGLDLKPFLSVKGSRNWQDKEWGGDVEPGFDAVYKITPSLSATLTINTDFAETEVDDRVFNLTRFSQFFPEKRDFFLEDSSIFNFAAGRRTRFLPFFSRRVGLTSSGEPAPILAGLKITGRIDDLNLGVMNVVQDESDGVELKNLAVVRAYYNVLEESTIGMLATWGDPRTNGENAVGGIDFNYRTRDFLGDKRLRGSFYVLGTHDDPDPVEDPDTPSSFGYAYNAEIQYPNDIIDAQLQFREVGEDYRPDLGFVRRRGTRFLGGRWRYRPRIPGDDIRRFIFGVEPRFWFRIDDGELESGAVDITPISIEFETGDEVGIELSPRYERLVDSFEIFDDVTIPVGDYEFTRFSVYAEFADRRKLSGRISVEGGSFYHGSRTEYSGRLTWRPSASFRLNLEAEYNAIDLPWGNFDTTVASIQLNFDFSPDLSWSLLGQWDDVSDSFGINSRVRWIVEPGNELFFVVNQAFRTAEDLDADQDSNFRLRAISTEVTVKVAWTFRF